MRTDLVAVISTEHLPSETAVKEAQLYSAEYEHGFFVWVGADLTFEEFPQWYADVCTWAKALKIEWVRFDYDADVVDDLKKWEW